jgi:hypothetical protein
MLRISFELFAFIPSNPMLTTILDEKSKPAPQVMAEVLTDKLVWIEEERCIQPRRND